MNWSVMAVAWLLCAFCLAITSVAATPKSCSTASTPTECLQDNCTWLVLEGRCHLSTDAVVRASPARCCSSKLALGRCAYHTDDLRDGDCSVSHKSPSRSFSLDYATRMLHFAGASYCNAQEIHPWDCGVHCAAISGISEQVYINNVSNNIAAFVAWDSIEDAVVVSFRGTVSTSIIDWVHNLEYTKTNPFTKYPSAGVHHGFWDSWNVLEPGIVNAIQQVLASRGSKPIHVTGHSLGAALATDAAISLKLKYGYSTSVVNFESPRAGDHNFMMALTEEVPDIWRITHATDIVPHAPPEAFGFYHAATEVFFPSQDYTNLTFTVCNGSGEDENCSDRCADTLGCTSVYDHLHVMGFVLGSDACTKGRLLV